MKKHIVFLSGEELRLQAIVDGIPFPVVEWYRENVLLKENGRIKLEMDERSGVCSLAISPAKKEDMGEYECMAKNPAGEASTYCEVVIDQLSDSDGRTKRNSKTKNERYNERQDPARGMSTDMMESDDEVHSKCENFTYFMITIHVMTNFISSLQTCVVTSCLKYLRIIYPAFPSLLRKFFNFKRSSSFLMRNSGTSHIILI